MHTVYRSKKQKEKQMENTVTKNGKTYSLKKDAYISDRVGMLDYYMASAIDEDDNECTIFWPIIDSECEDESDTCDWDNFVVKY